MHIYELASCTCAASSYFCLRHEIPPLGRTLVSKAQVPGAFLQSGFIVYTEEVLEDNFSCLLSLVQLLFGSLPQVQRES